MNNDLNIKKDIDLQISELSCKRTRKVLPKAKNLPNAHWDFKGGAGGQATWQNTCYCKTTIPFTCG